MTTQLLAVIGSVLAIIVGLWKYFTGKARAKQQRKDDALNEIKDGIAKKDPSEITGGIDNINNA